MEFAKLRIGAQAQEIKTLTTPTFDTSNKEGNEDAKLSEGGSFAERSDDRRGNEVDIYRILNGEESRTTIMVRNIPNKFK